MPRILFVAYLTCVGLLAQGTTGFHPRALPTDYASVTQVGDCTFAASVIPADQVKHLFPVDIGNTYVVVEFAAYPKMASVTLAPDDLMLQGAKPDPVRSSDAINVASVMEQKYSPKRMSNTGIGGYAGVEVGHTSGTDPNTGQRVNGTYTATQVGVTAGPSSPDGYPVNTGISPATRDALERELEKQSLPSGQFTAATAGYVYFPVSSLKKRADGTYRLDYTSDTLHLQLDLPAKPKPIKP